jgi:hypothetical protein
MRGLFEGTFSEEPMGAPDRGRAALGRTRRLRLTPWFERLAREQGPSESQPDRSADANDHRPLGHRRNGMGR